MDIKYDPNVLENEKTHIKNTLAKAITVLDSIKTDVNALVGEGGSLQGAESAPFKQKIDTSIDTMNKNLSSVVNGYVTALEKAGQNIAEASSKNSNLG